MMLWSHSQLLLPLSLLALARGLATPQPRGLPSQPTGTLHRRQYFYVGGAYASPDGQQVRHGQIYVERLTPAQVTQTNPILFVHGNGQTGTNWLNNPDGKPGWADYFLSQGFEVYILDQPARGRSSWSQVLDGPVTNFTTTTIENDFTAPQANVTWPQARLHTQWPDSGEVGGPYFDAYYSSVVQSLANETTAELEVQRAAGELMDTIGKAIVLTHSQAGAMGWIIADVRPNLVAYLLAIEPSGPPFFPAPFGVRGAFKPYGLTNIPLTYDQPVSGPKEFAVVNKTEVYDPATNATWVCASQKQDKVIKWVNLAKVKVLVVSSEASYHAVYDGCTVDFLRQAGVKTDYLRLAQDAGIKGNGHLMFLEKNQRVIAEEMHRRLRNAGVAR